MKKSKRMNVVQTAIAWLFLIATGLFAVWLIKLLIGGIF